MIDSYYCYSRCSFFFPVTLPEEFLERFFNLALTTHLIQQSMPQVVVGITISPSEASGKKGGDFR